MKGRDGEGTGKVRGSSEWGLNGKETKATREVPEAGCKSEQDSLEACRIGSSIC